MDKHLKSVSKMEMKSVEILQAAGIAELTKITIEDNSFWKCPKSECDLSFASLVLIKNHLIKQHKCRPFLCNVANCTWKFTTKSKLDRHKASHNDEKPFMCTYGGDCKKTFKTKANLVHHQVTFHEAQNKFPCPVSQCEAAFHNCKSLDSHVSHHKETKGNYECSYPGCNREFFTQGALGSHLRHHQIKPSELKCTFKNCNKVFKVPCRLKSHLLSHSDRKPFTCNVPGCKWSFLSASKLERHSKKHTQDRQFKCEAPDCNRAFLRKEHLKDHMVTHTDRKSYQCPNTWCSSLFSTKTLLSTHIKQQHECSDVQTGQLEELCAIDKWKAKGLVEVSPTEENPTVIINKGSARTSFIYSYMKHRLGKNDPFISSVNTTTSSEESREAIHGKLLALDSTRLTNHFEPSTINLRDLE